MELTVCEHQPVHRGGMTVLDSSHSITDDHILAGVLTADPVGSASCFVGDGSMSQARLFGYAVQFIRIQLLADPKITNKKKIKKLTMSVTENRPVGTGTGGTTSNSTKT